MAVHFLDIPNNDNLQPELDPPRGVAAPRNDPMEPVGPDLHDVDLAAFGHLGMMRLRFSDEEIWNYIQENQLAR